MSELRALFNKAGGLALLRQYARAGVLLHAVAVVMVLGLSRKSLELLRMSVSRRVQVNLRRRYAGFIAAWKLAPPTALAPMMAAQRKVWVCWLQGVDQAPPLVRRCYRSLQEHLVDRELVLLTDKNLSEYVSFPAHVQAKIDSGVITRTHLSDLIRLELLLRWGGTWIDATVLCSGPDIPRYMLDDDLFVFQNLKPGRDGHSITLSSWFMTAAPGHPIIALTRDLLNEYWRNNNSMVDYFLIHHFFQLATEACEVDWKRVVPFSNAPPHILQLMFFEPYDPQRWAQVRAMTPFHKLTYKFDPRKVRLPSTFYDVLIQSKPDES